jgi:hypothetical protein
MTETFIQDTMPVLYTQENSAPIGALQFSHHHITSISLWSALLFWKGGCHYIQDLGSSWMSKKFLLKVLQNCVLTLGALGRHWHGQDHFLNEQARAIHLNGFLYELQCFAAVVCIHWCAVVQEPQRMPNVSQNTVIATCPANWTVYFFVGWMWHVSTCLMMPWCCGDVISQHCISIGDLPPKIWAQLQWLWNVLEWCITCTSGCCMLTDELWSDQPQQDKTWHCGGLEASGQRWVHHDHVSASTSQHL